MCFLLRMKLKKYLTFFQWNAKLEKKLLEAFLGLLETIVFL